MLGVSQTLLRVRNPPRIVCVMQTQDLGPTGERTAENFKDLREQSGASLRSLSTKLDEIGRPIPPASLMKIEKRTRRVDVDDLMALALVLVFIGGKIFLVNITGKLPAAVSLGVTAGLLAGGVLLSLWKTRADGARSALPRADA